jgi:hypothetical protein
LAQRIPTAIAYCCSHIENVGVYASNTSLACAEELVLNMPNELTIRVGRHMLRDRGRVGGVHIHKKRQRVRGSEHRTCPKQASEL